MTPVIDFGAAVLRTDIRIWAELAPDLLLLFDAGAPISLGLRPARTYAYGRLVARADVRIDLVAFLPSLQAWAGVREGSTLYGELAAYFVSLNGFLPGSSAPVLATSMIRVPRSRTLAATLAHARPHLQVFRDEASRSETAVMRHVARLRASVFRMRTGVTGKLASRTPLGPQA